jgi:hypothetical protein
MFYLFTFPNALSVTQTVLRRMAGRLMDKVEKMRKEAIVVSFSVLFWQGLRKISQSFSPDRESKGALSNTSHKRYGLDQLSQLYLALSHTHKLYSSFTAREC